MCLFYGRAVICKAWGPFACGERGVPLFLGYFGLISFVRAFRCIRVVGTCFIRVSSS